MNLSVVFLMPLRQLKLRAETKCIKCLSFPLRLLYEDKRSGT